MAAEALTLRPAGVSGSGSDIALHSGDWVIEALELGTPAVRDELVSSADSDGAAVARVAKREPVEFSVRVRLTPQPTMDQALTKVRALEEALSGAERAYAQGITDPGLDAARLIWKPADSTAEGILPLLRAEISERPIVVEGEGVGWFLKAPVLTISGLRDPFIYGPLTAGSPANLSGSPLAQVVDIPAVGGSVPPWVSVKLEDTVTGAGRARNQVSMGLEVPGQATTLLYLAGTGSGKLDPAGLAGTVSSGRVTCTSSEWVGSCQVNGADHRGQYRVVASLVKGAGSIRFRWGVTGQAMTLNVEQVSDATIFTDLDLGAVSVDRDAGGSWMGVVEVTGTVSLAGLMLVPMAQWVSAETAPGSSALGAKVVDGTTSGAGELNGSALTLGTGTWSSTAGKWSRVSTPAIQRTTVSETGFPEIALAGTGTYTGVRFAANVQVGTAGGGLASQHGLILRYGSASNYAALRLFGSTSYISWLQFDLTIAGSSVVLYGISQSQVELGPLYPLGIVGLACLIDPQGNWQIWVAPSVIIGDEERLVASGQHPALATGGALASGRVGLIDRWWQSSACTRLYTNVKAHGTVGSVQPILPAKQSLELTPAGMVTVDGTDRRRVSHRGGAIMPPPDQASRLLVSTRRFNGMAMTEAEGKADNQRVTISTRKRWLQVP